MNLRASLLVLAAAPLMVPSGARLARAEPVASPGGRDAVALRFAAVAAHFQPGNDVREYAAEVALRWYREQRARLRGEPLPGPSFECGPEENRRAWEAIAGEFFAGVDLVPECGAGESLASPAPREGAGSSP